MDSLVNDVIEHTWLLAFFSQVSKVTHTSAINLVIQILFSDPFINNFCVALVLLLQVCGVAVIFFLFMGSRLYLFLFHSLIHIESHAQTMLCINNGCCLCCSKIITTNFVFISVYFVFFRFFLCVCVSSIRIFFSITYSHRSKFVGDSFFSTSFSPLLLHASLSVSLLPPISFWKATSSFLFFFSSCQA